MIALATAEAAPLLLTRLLAYPRSPRAVVKDTSRRADAGTAEPGTRGRSSRVRYDEQALSHA